MNSTVKDSLKVYSVNPNGGAVVAEMVAGKRGFDFGSIRPGELCPTPVVIKIDPTGIAGFSGVALSVILENDGGFTNSEFYARATSSVPEDYVFDVVGWTKLGRNPGATSSTGLPGAKLDVNVGANPVYIWLALKVNDGIGSSDTINFRII